MILALLSLFWLGCGGDTDDSAAVVAVSASAPAGWPALVVQEPAQFTRLVEQDGRPGWVALHAHDQPGVHLGSEASPLSRVT